MPKGCSEGFWHFWHPAESRISNIELSSSMWARAISAFRCLLAVYSLLYIGEAEVYWGFGIVICVHCPFRIDYLELSGRSGIYQYSPSPEGILERSIGSGYILAIYRDLACYV